jgi:glycosyltransferase involved in cell wall biosynthesis
MSTPALPPAGRDGRAFRLAIFTDTYDDVNGVSTIYRQFVAAANAPDAPPVRLDVFTLAERTGRESGPQAGVLRYRPRPRLALPRYPQLHTGVPPRRRIAADFAAGGYDAVVVATPGPIGFVGLRAATRAGRPLVGFYHTRFPAYLAVYARVLGRRYVPRMLERVGYGWMHRLYGPCQLVVCQSATVAGEVRRASDAPLAVWDTGVDLGQFGVGPAPAFRARHGLAPDDVVVAYVGRLAVEKGLETLVAVSRALPDVRFLVVGDGPYAATVRQQTHATFTGFLTGTDLADAYRAADLFLFPSVTDTFGNVLLEAMASGLPLVVTEGGAGAELVARSGAGLTFPVGDVAAAQQAVRRLADDAALRADLARRARAHAEGRDWPIAFRRFVELCEGVV